MNVKSVTKLFGFIITGNECYKKFITELIRAARVYARLINFVLIKLRSPRRPYVISVIAFAREFPRNSHRRKLRIFSDYLSSAMSNFAPRNTTGRRTRRQKDDLLAPKGVSPRAPRFRDSYARLNLFFLVREKTREERAPRQVRSVGL